MNKDVYMYFALAFFVLAIFAASMDRTVSAVIFAIGAAIQFLFYKDLP